MVVLSSMQSALLLVTIIASTSTRQANAFVARNYHQIHRIDPKWTHHEYTSIGRYFATVATEEDTTATKSDVVSSWEDLSEQLPNSTTTTPLVTLYRDTNGWCPFCERVWLALRVKNIPYRETLINLYDKPQWFKDMVPTALVPAVLIHTDVLQEDETDDDESSSSSVPPKRSLVWESIDIMKELDQAFPDHGPVLVREDDEDYLKAREVSGAVQKAGFAMLYRNTNTTAATTDANVITEEEARANFENSLDELDAYLAVNGPFLLGHEISGVDIEIIPSLERFRYQFPLLRNVDLLAERPHLKQWYDAMDGTPAYANRVAGDEYSWTAVASTFLRIFGARGGDPSPETLANIEKADAAAAALAETFTSANTETYGPEATLGAVSKLIQNHPAIVGDCTNADPQSQKELPRASDATSANLALRVVAQRLLNRLDNDEGASEKTEDELSFDSEDAQVEAAKALRTVALRLCVPRDMGAPAAAVLRKELYTVASEIEK